MLPNDLNARFSGYKYFHRHPLNIVTDGRPHTPSMVSVFDTVLLADSFFFSLSPMIRQRLLHTLTPALEQSDLGLLFYYSQLQI